ncbi:MAG: hypothetical protein HS129_04865 [Leptospiraceae bacterium]|nr:hypothetical protein [Leptospiraceae bacterium]NUM42481.1 hypothetical protein [Leptospiraceae bacterium]
MKNGAKLKQNLKPSRTEMNIIANAILKNTFSKKGIFYCEVCRTDRVMFANCTQLMGLTFSHRKKCRHYRTVEELSDFNEVVLSCLQAHIITERNPALTKKVFKDLRG